VVCDKLVQTNPVKYGGEQGTWGFAEVMIVIVYDYAKARQLVVVMKEINKTIKKELKKLNLSMDEVTDYIKVRQQELGQAASDELDNMDLWMWLGDNEVKEQQCEDDNDKVE
jgi:hypothetical protein